MRVAINIATPWIFLMASESSLVKTRCCICQAMLAISSKVIISIVFNDFFCFFLSLGNSLRLSWSGQRQRHYLNWGLLRMFRVTVIPRSFQAPVALLMSKPTIFGDRPKGSILGVRADAAQTFPLVHLGYRTLTSLLHDGGGWCQMNLDLVWLKKVAPNFQSWKQTKQTKKTVEGL